MIPTSGWRFQNPSSPIARPAQNAAWAQSHKSVVCPIRAAAGCHVHPNPQALQPRAYWGSRAKHGPIPEQPLFPRPPHHSKHLSKAPLRLSIAQHALGLFLPSPARFLLKGHCVFPVLLVHGLWPVYDGHQSPKCPQTKGRPHDLQVLHQTAPHCHGSNECHTWINLIARQSVFCSNLKNVLPLNVGHIG